MDWKVLAAVVVAAAIILSGFLSSSDMLKGLKDSIPDLFSIFSQNTTRSISLKADLNADLQTLELTDFDAITIISKNPSEIIAGKEKIDLSKESSVNLSISKFLGKYTLNFVANTIGLEGKADKIYISTIGVIPTEKIMTVKISNFKAESIKITNTSFKILGSKATSDNMAINDGKVALKLDNEDLKIENYNGDLDIRGSYVSLNGKLSRLAIAGKNKIEIK